VTCCSWTFPWPVPPPRSPLERGGRAHSISLNHLYVWTGRGGQRRLSTFAERTKHDWIKRVVDARQRLPAGLLGLDLAIHPPDAIRRDTDGPVKLAMDAVFEAYLILYREAGHPPGLAQRLADDYRVVDLHVHRHDPDRANPRIDVRVTAWAPGQEAPAPT